MNPRFTFEWNSVNKYGGLTSYQNIIYHYMIGKLASEDEAFVPIDCHIKIERDKECVKVKVYGVNEGLIREHLSSLDPYIRKDAQSIGIKGEYAGFLMYNRKMSIRPLVVNQFLIE